MAWWNHQTFLQRLSSFIIAGLYGKVPTYGYRGQCATSGFRPTDDAVPIQTTTKAKRSGYLLGTST